MLLFISSISPNHAKQNENTDMRKIVNEDLDSLLKIHNSTHSDTHIGNKMNQEQGNQ